MTGPRRDPSPVLELAGVGVRFGATQVLHGVDLQLRPGERHAVIGPNGAGKTTLFDVISGRVAPVEGTVHLDGRPICGLPPARIAALGVARSFQVARPFARLSAFDNLRCAVLPGLGHAFEWWRPIARLRGVAERAAVVLDAVGLGPRRDVAAGELTYAERRALEIGLAIAGDPGVLLLDEPTAGMSRPEAERAVDLIRTVSEGRSTLLVEHDMGVVFGLADRISVLVDGRVIASGPPDAIRDDGAVRAAYLGNAAGRPGAGAAWSSAGGGS